MNVESLPEYRGQYAEPKCRKCGAPPTEAIVYGRAESANPSRTSSRIGRAQACCYKGTRFSLHQLEPHRIDRGTTRDEQPLSSDLLKAVQVEIDGPWRQLRHA